MAGAPPIEQLLYISTVSPSQQVDLKSILSAARRNNRANNITGLLMFNGKRFLQVLEGPQDAIKATYERITRDTRHRGQVLLARRAIEHREFGDWSMGYNDGTQDSSRPLYEAICAKVADANPSLRAELTAFARQI